jgi:3-phosphoglycerate kinase
MTESVDSFTHVSTGGGASLKLLSGEKLDFLKSWEIYE